MKQLLAATCFTAVAILSAPAAQATQVLVGYADTLRPAGFFPTPWIGDTGVVSNDVYGCAGSGDCGAIAIDNRTGVTPVTVELGDWTVNFADQGNPASVLVIPAGDFGIFVLNDSSDQSFIPGAGPGTPAVGCTGTVLTNPNPAQTCPTFQLSFNGGAFTTFLDSGHVLDTNGWDEGGAGETEAFQWRPVGTSGTHSGLPEPMTLSIFGAGLVGAAALRRRLRKKA
jgi:hypothetical protein